jgi:hypothetical protein
VRQAGQRAIRSLLVNMLGALHCALHKAPRQRHPHAAKRARGTCYESWPDPNRYGRPRQHQGQHDAPRPMPLLPSPRRSPDQRCRGSKYGEVPELTSRAVIYRSSALRPRSIASITSARSSGPVDRQAISHPSSVAIAVIAAPAAPRTRTAPVAASSRYSLSRARAESGTHSRRAKRQ